MPANLSAMLRSVLKAKQAASKIELRFLAEVARTLPGQVTDGHKASSRPMSATRRRSLKCPRCDRRFARPVHLGRHLSATHGLKKRRKAA